MEETKMIRNNLANLLVERGIKAVKASNDTGIAQSTLSKISNNTSEKIDYSTINVLCKYLRVTPGDLLGYTPVDVDFSFFLGDITNSEDEMTGGAPMTFGSSGFINFYKYDNKLGSIEFEGHTDEYGPIELKNGKEVWEVNSKLSQVDDPTDFLKDLPIGFQTDITNKFQNFIKDELLNKHFIPSNDDYVYNCVVSAHFELPYY